MMRLWTMIANGSKYKKGEGDGVTYDELLIESDCESLFVKEKPLSDNDGRIKGRRIAIRKDIRSAKEKSCVLAEEMGHYYMNAGNILDQNDISNRKQEYRARLWGYNKKVGLAGLISAYEHGRRSYEEVAEHLDITEEYLDTVISCYRSKYGIRTTVDNYIIYFEPALIIGRIDGN